MSRKGYQNVSASPASARFRFGGGRLGAGRHATGIPVGIAGGKGAFAAFALDAEIPALLRKGALEVLGGLQDFHVIFRRNGN